MMLWQRQSILVGLRTSIICYLRPISSHILYLYALPLGIKNLRPLVEGAAACHLVVIFNIHLDLELLLHNLVDGSPCVDLALFGPHGQRTLRNLKLHGLVPGGNGALERVGT